MQEAAKIGAAAAGGYVLGRTKKAKAAIGLAMWLAGRRRPADLARDQATKLLTSPQVMDLISQLRGPLLAAGRQAALSVVEGQAGKLTNNLQRRTEKLGGSVVEAGSDVSETGTKTARRLTSRRRGEPVEDEAENADEYEDEYAEDEGEDGAEEYSDEYEDEDAEDEDAEDEGEEGPEEYSDEYEDEDAEDEGEEDEGEEGPEEYSDEYEDEDAEDEGEEDEGEESGEPEEAVAALPKPRRRSARKSSSAEAPTGRGRRSTRGQQQTRRGTSTRQRTGRPARRSA
jgi:hypothetical protein